MAVVAARVVRIMSTFSFLLLDGIGGEREREWGGSIFKKEEAREMLVIK